MLKVNSLWRSGEPYGKLDKSLFGATPFGFSFPFFFSSNIKILKREKSFFYKLRYRLPVFKYKLSFFSLISHYFLVLTNQLHFRPELFQKETQNCLTKTLMDNFINPR